jgi:hypothetical protein
MPNAPGGWSIESQHQTVGTGPDGRAVEGVRVSFVTSLGQHGSVFLPAVRYNKANVAAAVAAAAVQLDEILGLKG